MKLLGQHSSTRTAGIWLAAAVAAAGWALTAVVLVRGGGYFVVVPNLGWVLPVAALGTLTALASSNVGRPAFNTLTWFVAVAAVAFLWNIFIFWARFGSATWGALIPLAKPTGIDFRDGLYEPARAFTTVSSGWPPFTLFIGKPFTLFGFATAHVIEVALLVVAAAASVVLAAVLAARAGVPGALGADDVDTVRPAQVGLFCGLWLATSAGFLYEMERGNIDLLALVFALLGVWLMLKPRMSPWWPALALALAANIKLYPGVLLVLLLWRYRWRAVVPALVTNVALLLVAGPRVLLDTLQGRSAVESQSLPYWWGNHSAASTAVVFRDLWAVTPAWIYWPLLVVPILLWLGTLVTLVRRGWSDRRAVLLAAASVPVMSVVPAISHDYKLVLFVFPLAVLAVSVAVVRGRGTIAWAGLFALISWTAVQLSRSSLVMKPSLQNSKYLMIVLVQVLLLAVVVMTENGPRERAEAVERSRAPQRDAVEEEST